MRLLIGPIVKDAESVQEDVPRGKIEGACTIERGDIVQLYACALHRVAGSGQMTLLDLRSNAYHGQRILPPFQTRGAVADGFIAYIAKKYRLAP